MLILQLRLLFCLAWIPFSAAAADEEGTARSQIFIEPSDAFHEKTFALVLSGAPSSATVFYTLDGSEPTEARSRRYERPLTVSASTIIRAAAFARGVRISPVVTRTFLFLSQVIRQPANPPGLPSGSDAWNDFPSAYQMDPRIVDDATQRDLMIPALRGLPTLSVVCSREDLFGQSSGLYLNTTQRGADWEKRCSIEWIQTNGSRGFQIDCGIRVQGNYGRLPEKSPKHSFRLVFKSQYGAGKLRYPVFPDSKVEKFDTLVLRADYNNSWTHWQPQDQQRAQRTRDAWLKDSHRAMGWVAAHNRFVHLYLNGLYWGIYDLAERPDASFAAAYLGGAKEDFDVLEESGLKSGDRTAFQSLMRTARRKTPLALDEVATQLDLTEYIDYLLLNYYAGNGDWGEHKNWYAIRRRANGERFRYYVWDGEMILQGIRDDAVNTPGRPPFNLARRLAADPEFQLAFADRVQRHCFGNGTLTPAACIERWKHRADELQLAIVAESARWGYYRREIPFTRDVDWMKEQRRLVDHYFPRRTKVLLKQLQTAGLYPLVEAPKFLTPTDGAGEPRRLGLQAGPDSIIYFTRDGSDPRSPGTSTPSAAAQRYENPIPVPAGATLKARALQGTAWSALMEQAF